MKTQQVLETTLNEPDLNDIGDSEGMASYNPIAVIIKAQLRIPTKEDLEVKALEEQSIKDQTRLLTTQVRQWANDCNYGDTVIEVWKDYFKWCVEIKSAGGRILHSQKYDRIGVALKFYNAPPPPAKMPAPEQLTLF